MYEMTMSICRTKLVSTQNTKSEKSQRQTSGLVGYRDTVRMKEVQERGEKSLLMSFIAVTSYPSSVLYVYVYVDYFVTLLVMLFLTFIFFGY